MMRIKHRDYLAGGEIERHGEKMDRQAADDRKRGPFAVRGDLYLPVPSRGGKKQYVFGHRAGRPYFIQPVLHSETADREVTAADPCVS